MGGIRPHTGPPRKTSCTPFIMAGISGTSSFSSVASASSIPAVDRRTLPSHFTDNPDLAASQRHPFFDPAVHDEGHVLELQLLKFKPQDFWLLTPAELVKQIKHSWSSHNCHATTFKLPIHLGFMNVTKIDPQPLGSPEWWNTDTATSTMWYKVAQANVEEMPKERATKYPKIAQNRQPGQTLAYHPQAHAFTSIQDYAALLNYENTEALAQHTDCEVADYFGPLAALNEQAARFDSWMNILKSIPGQFTTSPGAMLFNSLAHQDNHTLRPVILRRGDMQDPTALSLEEKHMVATTPTVVATLLIYLKMIRTGQNGTGQPRYTQKWGPVAYTYGGYYIDDWLRAIFHMLFFLYRRKSKSPLDGKLGVREPASKVYVFKKEPCVETSAINESSEFVTPSPAAARPKRKPMAQLRPAGLKRVRVPTPSEERDEWEMDEDDE
ncbi:hypothetical protein B0H63DRAFT_450170 [Podospora didyma]|uniref:Uncharacterized protein n=1 Tax=Podospora didyma TaxID=330526 RepID=A0AAE0NRJ7_9PEZI|nr:hypothetical protein B0H63DRAFT_450170 [Podospora didyma]